jgi:phage terminase large subunit-like protein
MAARRKTAPKRARRKPVDPVTDYARQVVGGKIIAGRPVRLACKRHLADLKRKDLVWRPDRALLVIILPRHAGPRGWSLRPPDFQRFIVGSVFG